MSKYTQEVLYEYFESKHCIFWSKHGCFTASLHIFNTKRLISPEREGFRGQSLSGLYWDCIHIYVLLVI